VLQINPDQKDLRLDAAAAATWRERLAVITDGSAVRAHPAAPSAELGCGKHGVGRGGP
jgi:hypothetical protein